MRKLLVLIALTLGLAACGQETPAVNPDGSPAPQQSSGGFWPSLGGAFAGSMLGNLVSRPSAPAYAPSAPTTVVNRTTVIKQKVYVAPKPAAKVPNLVQRPSASFRSFRPPSPSPSRSFSSGRR